MENQKMIHKIKSKYILKHILNYIEDKNFHINLFFHSKYFQTKLDINLHTGKTHQIRAHLAHIGYPIIGDGKYGNNEINKKFGRKTQDLVSYKLIFKFKTNSGILNYLDNKEITL